MFICDLIVFVHISKKQAKKKKKNADEGIVEAN